ncbi:hypothetical protein AYM39_07575 [Methylomonas sp. DH-1]|nr:hypothetical protein AYM39_07575 [Methylomonas sp. DH-1]
MIMGDLTQFHIPIYQRRYTWESNKQVEKLISDLLEFDVEHKDNLRTDYYIGNVIVKNQTRAMMTERVVIDGQQRITTTILLLCAIRDIYLNKIKSDVAKQAARNITKSLYSEEDGDIKLKLNNMEHQCTLTTLLKGALETITPVDKKTNYWKNYLYIYKKLESMDAEQFDRFVNILERVKVVIIFFDDDQDENSVFESINSLGKPLSGSDLIKNFIFTFKNFPCSHSDENYLTELYTKNFESLFSHEKDIEKELESFYREYIAIKTQTLVNKDPKIIYYSFKKMTGEIDSFNECKDLVIDLIKWALIYQTLRTGAHKDIDKNHSEYLRASFFTYATLLMDIVDKSSHVENNELIIDNKQRINDALRKVVIYDVCRMLAGYPEKQITRLIPTITKKLEKQNENYFVDYAESFERLVTSTAEGYKQPSISALKRSVVNVDLYNRVKKKVLRFFILLENSGKNEYISFENDLKNCQIEHIMPQSLTGDWGYISEDVHEKLLHTLGNLSITFDNQELSNKPFFEKKKILESKSRITINKLLLDYETFDESAICARSLKILEMFLKIYGIYNKSEFNKEENSVDWHENDIFGDDFSSIRVSLSTNRGILAYAKFVQRNKFIVEEGSTASANIQPSLQEALILKREELIAKGVMIPDGDFLVFTKDYEFTSPSQAAGIIKGISSNGKNDWKDHLGASLNELGY